MAGFLSADQITKVRDLADTLHTTFARTITVYKNAKKTLIASTNSWNAVYRRTNTGENNAVEYTTVYDEFEARIYYDDMDTSYLTDDGPSQQAGTHSQSHITKHKYVLGASQQVGTQQLTVWVPANWLAPSS